MQVQVIYLLPTVRVAIDDQPVAVRSDAPLFRKIARDNARQKIWPLEGYLLKETIFLHANMKARQTEMTSAMKDAFK